MTELNNVNKGEELIPFLRTLADSIEQETILPEQLRSISTFFMSYKFQEQEIKDDNGAPDLASGEYDEQELIKFISLGWYIYCVLLKDKS